MELKELLNILPICIISALLVLFASLYFMGTKKRKKLTASINDLYNRKNTGDLNKPSQPSDDGVTAELVEQLSIIHSQLDLIFELSPAFIICYDYARDGFYISDNGRIQLGYAPENPDGSNEDDQRKFESLIHEDSASLYEEVTNFEDIRKLEVADSPYIIKIKNAVKDQYGEYLMRIKPIYDEDGINKALIAAFINTEYIENQNE